MMKQKRTPTMKDVANLAGVTQPTVSYVINGTANISPEVTQRVKNAIETLGYRPNILAQSLKTRSTKTIGLLLPNISNSYYSTIANEVERELRNKGYITFLACSNHDSQIEQLYINSFIQHNVAGIIITYSLADNSLYSVIKNYQIPVVALDDDLTDKNIPCITVCNEYGGRLATQYLIKLGHRKIALATEPLLKHPIKKRIDGYKSALIENGIQFSDKNIFIVPQQKYIHSMGLHLGSVMANFDIDAIFATSDHLALGILKSFSQMKIRVPEDISLIGYDDVFASQVSTPALTTISQPIKKIATRSALLLLEIIKKQPPKPMEPFLPALVVRETTCPKTA